MACERARPCRARRAERTRQREVVLRLGGSLGWSPDAVIAFTEALTGRPWRQCSHAELRLVLREYRTLVRVIQAKAARRALRSRTAPVGGGHAATE